MNSDYTLMILCRNHVDGKCKFYQREWNGSNCCIFAKISIGNNNYLCSNLDAKERCLKKFHCNTKPYTPKKMKR